MPQADATIVVVATSHYESHIDRLVHDVEGDDLRLVIAIDGASKTTIEGRIRLGYSNSDCVELLSGCNPNARIGTLRNQALNSAAVRGGGPVLVTDADDFLNMVTVRQMVTLLDADGSLEYVTGRVDVEGPVIRHVRESLRRTLLNLRQGPIPRSRLLAVLNCLFRFLQVNSCILIRYSALMKTGMYSESSTDREDWLLGCELLLLRGYYLSAPAGPVSTYTFTSDSMSTQRTWSRHPGGAIRTLIALTRTTLWRDGDAR